MKFWPWSREDRTRITLRDAPEPFVPIGYAETDTDAGPEDDCPADCLECLREDQEAEDAAERLAQQTEIRDRLKAVVAQGDAAKVLNELKTINGGVAWIGVSPWGEHIAPVPTPLPEPTPPPVIVEPVPVPSVPVVVEPVVVPETPATCGKTGTVDGKQTVCMLPTGHKYLNGNLSPHKGVVPTVRTWTNTG